MALSIHPLPPVHHPPPAHAHEHAAPDPDLDADPAWEIARRSGVATIAADEGDEGVDYEFVTYRRVEA